MDIWKTFSPEPQPNKDMKMILNSKVHLWSFSQNWSWVANWRLDFYSSAHISENRLLQARRSSLTGKLNLKNVFCTPCLPKIIWYTASLKMFAIKKVYNQDWVVKLSVELLNFKNRWTKSGNWSPAVAVHILSLNSSTTAFDKSTLIALQSVNQRKWWKQFCFSNYLLN